MEWDPKHFRLFVGDLGNDVNEDDLVKAFGPDKGWTSFVKAKVVRDKVTNKTRGYGFVSYSDPEDFMKAWKAMNGKYVGSRPVKLQKATTQVRQVDIGQKKAKELDTKKKSHVIGNKVCFLGLLEQRLGFADCLILIRSEVPSIPLELGSHTFVDKPQVSDGQNQRFEPSRLGYLMPSFICSNYVSYHSRPLSLCLSHRYSHSLSCEANITYI